MLESVDKQMREGFAVEDVKVDLSIRTLKPLVCHFIKSGFLRLQNDPDMVKRTSSQTSARARAPSCVSKLPTCTPRRSCGWVSWKRTRLIPRCAHRCMCVYTHSCLHVYYT